MRTNEVGKPQTKPSASIIADPQLLYRLTVVQYEKCVEVGVLTKRDRVELLEGLLVAKHRQTPQHATSVSCLGAVLRDLLPKEWFVRQRNPICTENSVPEPDCTIVRGEPRRYVRHHPRAADVGLVVEAADSEIEMDRTRKCSIYACAEIPEYWILDLNVRVLEALSRPRSGRRPAYAKCRVYQSADKVPLMLDGREIAEIPVSELLP